MARISATLTPTQLVLHSDEAGSISVPRRADTPTPELRKVWIWRSKDLLAEDCGPDVAAWLSALLGKPCHLVRIGGAFRRPVLERRAAQPGESLVEGRVLTPDLVSFADGFPLLAVNQASLDHLNDRLIETGAEPTPLDRFRANLVVSGPPAFAEDAWSRVRIGDITFRSGGPCARCIVITTDQLTGERSHEPLRTLATYRRDAEDSTRINFGLNLTNETKSGSLRIGDAIQPL
jgi:hypothetical protein